MKKVLKSLLGGIALFSGMIGSVALADTGKLYLVSTGCGDLDNMTIKAHKIIESADVVFTMRGDAGRFQDLLQGKEIYAAGHILFGFHNKKGDKHIHEAKEHSHKEKKHGHGLASEERKNEIRSIIRDAVNNGKTVAILDGGDPTIFGPQMGYIKEFADLDPTIIPGVSSFNAANAALKRSVVGGPSMRSIALTSSPRPRGESALDASEKADPSDAIVFFTMHSDLSETVAEFKKHYSDDTPIAIVLYAGYSDKERVIQGTLADIISKVGTEKLPFEHLIYVGNFIDS